MRLWSLHPCHLDPQGLVALWREGLLARAVLRGETRGYQHHPQLERFRARPDPVSAIDAYLGAVHDEAVTRGYRFDRSKLGPVRRLPAIPVSTGQLELEWDHLGRKLAQRNPAFHERWRLAEHPQCHPSFAARPGPIESWERAAPL